MLIKTKLMTACAGVLLIGGIGASVASAKIVVDVRQDGTDAKVFHQPTLADLNKPITLNVFAQVTSTDTATSGTAFKETLASIHGAMVSAGPTRGTIAPNYFYPDPDTGDPVGPLTPFGDPFNDKVSFNGSASQNGLSQDIDGDGDMDLGGKLGDGVSNWIVFRTDKKNMGWATGQGKKLNDFGGVEFQLGQIIFTPSAFGVADTFINFRIRSDASGNTVKEAGLWTEDGTGASSLRDGSSGVIEFSPFIIPPIPEPATLSLLGLGAAMLLGRRNRK
ncbi:MAG: PEP-CTERM sorting domain-containing protein [Planctomycetota bacterium]|nr:PEP-CTERM sorting domain-containing protein [Planctomycetota bacterium]